jgi:hypothetical protein
MGEIHERLELVGGTVQFGDICGDDAWLEFDFCVLGSGFTKWTRFGTAG